ncbi:PQQ-dependent sugar dehydrogenase [Actinokineospora xionganensis]|uniref:PQQ-dependent sugar dehydrogenase n=1 Tax=Actinokineospora xionganensis TaxID=2684470 RepID=A0ABR7L867_9PSEU|nr:PQQ-dependent sugar dehydrogenase [Actinokineospora xionganensis]MBC6448886.1 PQQ-dependent sugar dehydrogenase [Actinokineospora xionganensis]
MSGTHRRVRALAAACVASALLASCATFEEQPPPQSWQAEPPLTPQAAPEPDTGGGDSGGGGPAGEQRVNPPGPVPPPDGCKDFHPAVLATCLDTVVAVAALPGDGSTPSALVGERKTGRILLVRMGSEPVVVATVPVDGSTDGGLTGLALSPTFVEDQLLFAYITTPTDNRLVRIAPNDTPKPVLTGIPRGASGNRGALANDHRGALLIATGNAGNAAAAADPASLAGKVLRINSSGKPAEDNPTPTAVVASGLESPGGLCSSLDGSRVWVTDRTAAADVLYRLDYGKPLGAPAWSWPDKPGISGCASPARSMWVAMSKGAHLQNLAQAPDGTFTGKPQVVMAEPDGFGRVDGLDLLSEQLAIGGTVNKEGGKAASSDDRAVVIVVEQGGGGSGVD